LNSNPPDISFISWLETNSTFTSLIHDDSELADNMACFCSFLIAAIYKSRWYCCCCGFL